MRMNVFRAIFAAVTVAACCMPVFSQDSRIRAAAGDRYVISAKAGGVNETVGSVSVVRARGQNGSLLKGDELEIGDRVSTSADGRAEILLNPGSYFRVGGGSSFEFLSTSLDDLRLKLRSGSAVFEVIADDDFRVTVLMPRTALAFTRSGVYRVDVLGDGSSKLSVWKGKVMLGPESTTEVKAGRTATVAGVKADVAKFDRDDRDELTNWSKDRAKVLSKMNARLQRSAMRNTLLNSFNSLGGWNLYDSFGLWVRDPLRRSWCFMPFGSGWGSPYGYYYGFDLWNVRLPNWVYYTPPPNYPPATGTPGPTTPPAGPPASRGDNVERRNRIHTPPFMRMENNPNNSGAGVVDRGAGFGNSGSPMFSGPPASSGSSRSASPAPAPTRIDIEPPASNSPMRGKDRPDNR